MAPPPRKKARETPAACQPQHLPDGVIEDILARLPAKSVLRCRCLSRAWAAVISSRRFADRHHGLANRRRRGGPRLLFPSESSPTLCAWLRKHPNMAPLTARPCRGLVIVAAVPAGVVYVLNPSTGQMAALPDGRMTAAGYACCFGLGYDDRAGCHKVVRVFNRCGRSAGCEVYDSGDGSKGYWRQVAARPPCLVHAFRMAGVFSRGHVHWLPSGCQRPKVDWIMSFSVADETFKSLPLPRRACRSPAALDLTDLDGHRLCLLMYARNRSLYIWTLGEGYDAGVWNLLCRVGAANMAQLGSPLATVDDGRRILFRSHTHVTAYGPATGALEPTLLEPGMDLPPPWAEPYEEESLVFAGRPYEDILFSSPFAQALSLALRRLPARTLGRAKCVCRSWRAIIESDRFVVSHSEHHRGARAAVVFMSCFQPWKEVASLDSRLVLDPGTMTMPPLMNTRVFISKPCHGLALASRRGWSELFNPVTRLRRRFLVRHSFELAADAGDDHGSIGLGYDQSREEHVLVLLAATLRCPMECKVWRMRDHGEARAIPAPPIVATLDVPPVYLDGRMYWMCRSPERAVLAFDIRAEAFHVLLAPPGTGGVNDDCGTELLVELGGALCAVHSCRRTETMTIWLAAGDGGWTRECVMQLARWPEFSPKTAAGLVIPMAIEPSDGRILLDTGRALGYYDPINRTLETVYSLHSKLPSERRFFAAAFWVESLARPYYRSRRFW